MNDYISNLALNYCKSLIKAIEYRFKVVNHEGIKIVDFKTNYQNKTKTMILNLTGQAGAGKTTISKELLKLIPNSINVDGDELRDILKNKDYSETGRRNNIKNAYNIALFLEKKGFTPIISLISPFKDLREELKQETEVFECYIFTTEIRGREHFFAKDYEAPTSYFLPIDTTGRNEGDVAKEIETIFKNKLFTNINQ